MGKINDLKLGDVVENKWAIENNPHRISIFVRYANNGGRILCTDGKGDLGKIINDNDSRTIKLGTMKAIPEFFKDI
jgi:hypothetical protein